MMRSAALIFVCFACVGSWRLHTGWFRPVSKARSVDGLHASSASMSAGLATERRSPIEFFTLDMCPYAQRVWIALEELGVPYIAKTVNLRGDDREWYTTEINPRAKVPAIRDPDSDGLVIYESLICLEYLAEQAGSTSVLPSSPSARARMRLWNEHLDTQLAPAHFTLLMNKNESTVVAKRAALDAALVHYETNLEGPFLLGEFSLADVAAAPFFERLVFSLGHFQDYEALANYPRVSEWLRRVMDRPSVAATLRPEDKLIELYERFLSMDYAFGGLNKN